jgi:OOP family OmpA-OmpF porin
VPDESDKCPEEAGVAEYEGCPIPDSDGDGVLDPDDKCPDVAGSPDYEGCEVPDTDGDGFKDDVDKCVEEPGVEAYEGCPIPDKDGDGILDPDDKCVDQPETKNSYEDEDGCPDEIPEVVRSFVGVIEGIYFDTGKASIRKKSRKALDKAVEVLKQYPALRLEITGHTDGRGKREKNLKLSHDRAESVRKYMVDAGVALDRLEIAGFGPDKPVDTNDTRAGRQKNRRIEFRLLRADEHAAAEPGAEPVAEAKPAVEAKPADEAKPAPKAEEAKPAPKTEKPATEK